MATSLPSGTTWVGTLGQSPNIVDDVGTRTSDIGADVGAPHFRGFVNRYRHRSVVYRCPLPICVRSHVRVRCIGTDIGRGATDIITDMGSGCGDRANIVRDIGSSSRDVSTDVDTGLLRCHPFAWHR